MNVAVSTVPSVVYVTVCVVSAASGAGVDVITPWLSNLLINELESVVVDDVLVGVTVPFENEISLLTCRGK